MTVGGVHDLLNNSYGAQQTQTAYVDRPNQTDRQIDEPGKSRQPDLTGRRDNLTSTAEPVRENPASRMADLKQVSLTFNSEDSFEYIGMDSDLNNLDMKKAISDMQKDQVLQNYQYFVGSAGGLFEGMPTEDGEDGMVVIKP